QFQLTPHESSRFDIRGRQDQVTVDASVNLSIGGVLKQSEKPKSELSSTTIEAYREAGKHFFELCVALGGRASPKPGNTHRDPVPTIRSLLDISNQVYGSSPEPLLLQLMKIAEMQLREILSGETPDVSTASDMACQLAMSLQAQRGVAAAGTGKTPPPGMK